MPDDLKHVWLENFELIQKLGKVKFRRETIEMADASQNLACSAVYERFKLKSGSYFCQLLFNRSKIVPAGMSMPKAELFAALLNATTGHVVFLVLTADLGTKKGKKLRIYWRIALGEMAKLGHG